MELFGRIRAELLRSGYVRAPVVYVHPANGPALPKLQVRAPGGLGMGRGPWLAGGTLGREMGQKLQPGVLASMCWGTADLTWTVRRCTTCPHLPGACTAPTTCIVPPP